MGAELSVDWATGGPGLSNEQLPCWLQGPHTDLAASIAALSVLGSRASARVLSRSRASCCSLCLWRAIILSRTAVSDR